MQPCPRPLLSSVFLVLQAGPSEGRGRWFRRTRAPGSLGRSHRAQATLFHFFFHFWGSWGALGRNLLQAESQVVAALVASKIFKQKKSNLSDQNFDKMLFLKVLPWAIVWLFSKLIDSATLTVSCVLYVHKNRTINNAVSKMSLFCSLISILIFRL